MRRSLTWNSSNAPSLRLLLLPLYLLAIAVVAVVATSLVLKVDRVVVGHGVLVPPDDSVRVTACGPASCDGFWCMTANQWPPASR